MSFLKTFFFILFSSSFLLAQSQVIRKGNLTYLANEVVIKLKSSSYEQLGKISLSTRLEQQLEKYGVKEITNRFSINGSGEGREAETIKSIFKLVIDTGVDPLELSQKLSKLPEIEWAEPNYVREIFYTPNDSLYNVDQDVQWNLYKVQADLAWSICKGDPNVIIAIVDTGVDWDHPDLMENIWQNLGEDFDQDGHTIEFDPVQGKWILDPGDLNGVDDDDYDNNPNTFVDDFVGWDFQGWSGISDNDPVEDTPVHGTHVAGIASAVTDNSYGVASLGFNCSIMPVKNAQHDVSPSAIINGHEGIIYAADNGARVINCSWGGPGFSLAEKAAVDYAISKGALVIASAGNEGDETKNYPAAYDGVLSVGGTDKNDIIRYNYGTTLDVMSPSRLIYSTYQEDRFASKDGTSMAAPLVSGLAGLVFSSNNFKDYSPMQVLEQIRINCDDIYEQNPDIKYQHKLGKGRINAYSTLNNVNSYSVRATEVQFIDQGDGDGRLESGETVLIRVKFVNYLSPVTNVDVNIQPADGYITLLNWSFSTGQMGTLGEKSNQGNEFSFQINNNTPYDQNIDLCLLYANGSYSGCQWLTINVNPTYLTVAANNIGLTITSNGSLGFNDFPNNTKGNGLIYLRGTNLLYEGAFMYGTSSDKVMDGARVTDDLKSGDFSTIIKPLQVVSGTFADEESYSTFNDDGAGSDKLGIETELRTYSFTNAPDDNYIILRYLMTNKSGADISGLYAGIFFDLDLDETDWEGDLVKYDQTDDFGYVYDEEGSPTNIYIGTSLISSTDYGFYAIANNDGGAQVNLINNFPEADKWITLSSGLTHNSVNTAQDISFVVSGGPFVVANNSTLNVAFVLAAGASIEDVRSAVQQSRIKYGNLPTYINEELNTIPIEFSLSQNYPNPFNPETRISYSVPSAGNQNSMSVRLQIYDLLGREAATLVDERQNAGSYTVIFNAEQLPSGVYFYNLKAGAFNQTRKMILVK